VASPLDYLPPGSGDRLTRFARAFERLSVDQYALFAAADPDAGLRARARESVEHLIGRGSRHEAVTTAVAEFRNWATLAFSRLGGLDDVVLGSRPSAGQPRDQVRFLETLEPAVVALILWDLLPLEDRDELLGPWHDLAMAAAT
jgi:hypothetical protein